MNMKGLPKVSASVKNKLVKWFVTVVCVYVIVMSTCSLWADGWIYKVVQPLPVVAQSEHSVTLRWTRYSRRAMKGTCYREIVCDVGSDTYPMTEPVIEPGWETFDWDYVIPADAAGVCVIQGIVEYDPVGKFGPRLSYYWKSEKFVAGDVVVRVW